MHRTLISTALVAVCVVSSATLAAAADNPPDTVELATLDVEVGSRAYTLEYLTRDSDGDGWTDWYERLDGTDPNDPSSHPGAVRVDVMDATVFVQSHAHPERIVALDDLELPATKDSFGELTDLIASITGTSSLGKFRDELVEGATKIAGDRIGDILSDVATHHERPDPALGGRTNGQLTSLISWELGASVGSTGATASLTSERGGVEVKIDQNGITTVDTDDYRVDGTGAEFTTVRVNGTKVMTIHTESVNGTVVGVYPTDASGNPLPPMINPSSSATTVPADTKPAEAAPETTAAPKPAETTPPTTTGDYSNPDADPVLYPTAAEIEARIAFLSGVKTRYLTTVDLPAELDKDKPGVLDPAEPECRDERCVVFTEITHPDLDRAAGACPRTFCNSDPRLGSNP